MCCRTDFRKLSLFSFAVLLTVAALAFTAPSQVAPASIFELDGNSVVNTSGNCDWNPLNAGKIANSTTPTTPCAQSGVTANGYGFLEGAPGEPNFSTGGSKDSNDVSQWLFTSTSTPDKDTLTHGYAAGYTATAGDKLLVFGAERFAVNGDSNIGIWFFQNAIGTTGGSKGAFTGVHAPGDILIVSAFTAGGGASTISVYEWAPAGQTTTSITCPNSNYPNLTSSTVLPACAAQNLLALFFNVSTASNSGSSAFAIVNPIPTTIGWPYEAKFGGSTNQVPTGGFYEGGINLSALLPSGSAVPCFSSFLFETRSSQSTSAVLKDFLVGGFPQCHLSITKACTCNSFNADGSFNYSYGGDVINDGGGDLFNIMVTDTTATGAVVTYSCGNLPRGTSPTPTSKHFPSTACPLTGSDTNTWTDTAHQSSNHVDATAKTASSGGTTINAVGLGGTALGFNATCTDLAPSSCSPSPSLSVAKRCVTAFQASGSNIIVRVDYTGEVTNTGTVNLNSVNVVDDVDGQTFGAFSLAVGESKCYTNGAATCPPLPVTTGLTTGPPAGAASYNPSSAQNPLGLGAGRIQFTDTVTASGKDPKGTRVPLAPPDPTASAQCLICPGNSCPAP